MRDFDSGDLEDYLAETASLRAGNLEETGAMAEQGFKRFRRKNRAGSEPVVPVVPVDLARPAAPEPVAPPIASSHAGVPEQAAPSPAQPDPSPQSGNRSGNRSGIKTPDPEPDRDAVSNAAPEEEAVSDVGETSYDTREEVDKVGEVDEVEETVFLPARTPEPWEMLRQVPLGARRHIMRRSALISFFRDDPAAKQFDLLRTRLLKTLKEHGWSRVAIVSPTNGCGATFTAVNLALSLARVPETRTVLMDLNQRNPGIGAALDIQAMGDMPGFLMGEVPLEHHLVRCSPTLAVGIAAQPDRNAAEILHDPQSADTLDDMHEALRPDVVLYDLPPLLEHDDMMAFLPQVDGVLLVADGTSTTAADLEACERVLDNQTQLLGVLLNRGR